MAKTIELGSLAAWISIALALAALRNSLASADNLPWWYDNLWFVLIVPVSVWIVSFIQRLRKHGKTLEIPPPSPATFAAHGDGSANVAGQMVNLQDSAVGPGASATHIEHYHEAPRVPTPPSPLHTLRDPVADFTGREEEIAELTTALTAPDDCNTALISGIRGMGGVGKTELALVVCRALAPRYPDAQIMLELQAGDTVLAPETLLGQVITAFAPGAKLPDSLAELQAMCRDALRGKKGLLLLDNARDGAQVAPLLPPPAGWAVLVTSRETFALDGGCAVDLNVLPPEKAAALAHGILQTGKRAATDAEVAKLADLCGRLPLALRLAADFLVVYKDWSVAEYLKALEKERLKYLHVPGKQSVFASLGISVAQLEKDASEVARLWRLLGAFPAPFDRDAARAVWGDLVTRERDLPKQLKGQARDELKRRLSQRGYLIAALVEDLARFTLSELLRRSLLDWDDAKEEYYLHDLLREYAVTPPLPEGWDGARRRHAAHYLEVGAAANGLYLEGGENVLEGLRRFDAAWPHLRAAWDWMAGAPAGGGSETRPCGTDPREPSASLWLNDFPYRMACVLNLRLPPRQHIPYLETAVVAARLLGDKQAEEGHLGNVGIAYATMDDPKRAIEFHQYALFIAREIRDRLGEGNALGSLGQAYSLLSDPKRAAGFYEQALQIHHEIGHRRGEGAALNSLGLAYASLGDPKRAIGYHAQALAIAREIGDFRGEGLALMNLATSYHQLGDVKAGITYDEQALAIMQQIGDRRYEGGILGNLGLVYADLGDPKKAIGFYEQALVIDREIGNRRGEGSALGNLGNAYLTLGDPKEAIEYHEQALKVMQEVGDKHAVGSILGNLGNAYAALGDPKKAIGFYEQAHVIDREIGDRTGEARASWNLGLLLEQQGDDARAAELMQVCVDYERSIGHPDAEKDAARVAEVRGRIT